MGRWALLHSLASHDLPSALVLLLASVCVILGYVRGLGAMLGYPVASGSEWSVSEPPVTLVFIGVGVLAVLAVGAFPQWLLPAVTRTVDAFVMLMG